VHSDFLIEVRRRKEARLAAAMERFPLPALREAAAQASPERSLREALARASAAGPPALIAEVKRRSPSAGLIRQVDDPALLAGAYERGGAAAVSVLTEEAHFGGSLDDLRAVRAKVDVPVLRKDFLIHPYELYEARAAGADAVLLIVALLGEDGVGNMLEEARSIGLECLVEVHDEEELAMALRTGTGLIGLNNRNLRTLEVDLATARRLAPLVPLGTVAVAESGYRTRRDIEEAMAAGIKAFLIGEALMRDGDPEEGVRRFLHPSLDPGKSGAAPIFHSNGCRRGRGGGGCASKLTLTNLPPEGGGVLA
jgi:indole-3-glycerol phosphate synthase